MFEASQPPMAWRITIPLEVANAWVLATESVAYGSIPFTDDHCYAITCKVIIIGRVFAKDHAGDRIWNIPTRFDDSRNFS